MKVILLILLLSIASNSLPAQQNCESTIYKEALSPRSANYIMNLVMDGEAHKVEGKSTIQWINSSPDTVSDVHLYMYLNAFKNTKTSYLRPGGRRVSSGDLNTRKPDEWGWITVKKAHQHNNGLLLIQRYIQPDDGNPYDETVLQITLASPILPLDTLLLEIEYESKLPRIISRVGYAEHSYNHWVHSYPKMGVYEQDIEGTWGWNCHQFLPSMEFYGDHGNYNVTIDAPSSYVIGASGCLNKEEIAEDRTLHTYIAEDVIDFAWVASPFLEVQEDQWEHVEIRYLYPSSHEGLKKRLIGAAKNALTYMKEHVGEYPYTTLTIIDPPIYGLRSGFMEYPTYITGGAFHCWPEEVRSIESLIIHEFAHQYFMQILASNEKEEPWLDEGFVTFYEDCIMEDAYGSEASLSGAWGYNVPNSAFTRNEYASLPNPRVSPIAVPSWEINDAYKGIIYSKTATVLQTIKEHLGEDKFDEMMKSYFELNKFSHPRRENFINILRTAFEKSDSHLSENLEEFINQSLDGTQVCDYTVTNISNNQAKDGTGWFSNNNDFEFKESNTSNEYFSRIRLERKGDFIIPVEVKLTWANGDTEELIWDGRETVKYLVRTGKEKIISAEIDPRFLVRLDIDRNNNSFTLEPNSMGIWKYALRSLSWVQNALQATNVLM
ncbi:MAG: hypothetical protein ACJA01_003360 [Saprospiraceae bacterium]|jgi:hypothetical protein